MRAFHLMNLESVFGIHYQRYPQSSPLLRLDQRTHWLQALYSDVSYKTSVLCILLYLPLWNQYWDETPLRLSIPYIVRAREGSKASTPKPSNCDKKVKKEFRTISLICSVSPLWRMAATWSLSAALLILPPPTTVGSLYCCKCPNSGQSIQNRGSV